MICEINMADMCFSVIVSCMPIQSHWDQNVEGTCVDEPKLFTVALGTDVATDGE